jgi:metallo-beta-lactamase family protein
MTLAVHFLGAAQEVTGSLHLIESSRGRILIDCGLFQGRRADSRERNAKLPRVALDADAVILTHAHIDHSGNLPMLVKSGFRGRVFATPATVDLCEFLLRDAARIQEGDAAYLNKRNADDPDWTPIVPLYTEDDAAAAMARFQPVAYEMPFTPLEGVKARFLDAGHILGSAQVLVEIDGRRLLFSGDLGRRGMPILRDPAPPPAADAVFMESTYGNRAHSPITETLGQLEEAVKYTCREKGKLIVPAFAVGRTQELVYGLHQLHSQGRIPDIPIFVDSPLSVNVTEVFGNHPECYDEETRAFMQKNGDPFTFSTLRYISSREESIRLNTTREPCVIISSSGMCEAGRIVHHLQNSVEDARNTILIVGFQAQHTLGRRIVERRPRLRIFGVERELHARVVVMNAFSAHGDKNDLHDYALATRPQRGLYLIHGELDQQEPLADYLRGKGLRVDIPKAGDTADLS